MTVFTTNWYLYKPHFNTTIESQIRNSGTVNEACGLKKRKNFVQKIKVEENIEL